MAGVQLSPHMAIHRNPPILRMASCLMRLVRLYGALRRAMRPSLAKGSTAPERGSLGSCPGQSAGMMLDQGQFLQFFLYEKTMNCIMSVNKWESAKINQNQIYFGLASHPHTVTSPHVYRINCNPFCFPDGKQDISRTDSDMIRTIRTG